LELGVILGVADYGVRNGLDYRDAVADLRLRMFSGIVWRAIDVVLMWC